MNYTLDPEILRRLSLAKAHMAGNYHRNVLLGEVALVACLSVNHFLRTFKRAYGESPHQFLTRIRLEQARYYLLNTKYAVSEIVDKVGFECPSSFIRLFKHSYKTTPGQYRESRIIN